MIRRLIIFVFFSAGCSFLLSLSFLFTLLFTPLYVEAQTTTTAAQQAALQAELVQVEAQEQQAQDTLTKTQSQSASLQRDITVLTSKIQVDQLNIKAKNLLIQTLNQDIGTKQQTISNLTAKLNQGKDTLAQLLRQTNELDNVTLPEVILSEKNLTGLFSDVDTFASVETSLESTFQDIVSTQNETQTEENQLTDRKNQQTDALAVIQQDQQSIKVDETAQQKLLNISKGNEKQYTQLVAQKQAQAAQIRAALFTLAGGGNGIPFGQALQYAQVASAKTSVSPAFLLAILTQESALGANVGQCYVTNMSTGAGVSAKTGSAIAKVMSPTRDTTPFQAITSALGLDPYKMVVSCPQSIGWGGAMGPAQFIPSTWVLFQDRIASALNEPVSAVNPWNPQDAFMASALYLGDLGALNGSYTGEETAACKYYSGKACGIVSGARSYALSVLNTYVPQIQDKIDQLQD